MNVFQAVLLRDLRVAFRRWSELAHPLIFFIIVVTLFNGRESRKSSTRSPT
jgi:ABC-type transport system involved in cytochrome c biogenesis permease component